MEWLGPRPRAADRVGSATTPAGPAIEGWYADPALVAFGDTYWIFPTTDGTPGWAATAFRAFSSPDLRVWTDHGEILSVPRDTTWATGHAWAPAMVKRAGTYYLYFTADENIGVARGPSPTGPFADLGVPLVAAGAFAGAAIDPSVFIDDDGRAYLYWGNSVAHGVELGEDMVSFDANAVHSWRPTGFREAAWVHRRGEVYYLSWSENDTRDPDYRVRYATSSSPLGPWTDHGVLLAGHESRGIVATGHHSIMRVPGSDTWLIAYHRFAIPGGDGHHREVVIDQLHHGPDGLLRPVLPGHGIPNHTAR